MTMKPYGGKIEGWSKFEWPEEIKERYKEDFEGTLGYAIKGWIGKDHRDRGFDNGPIRTSLVVKFSETEIETMNTRYDLGEPAI